MYQDNGLVVIKFEDGWNNQIVPKAIRMLEVNIIEHVNTYLYISIYWHIYLSIYLYPCFS